MHQSTESDRRPRVATAFSLLMSVAIMSACAGENLFSLAATGGASGPEVNITAPVDNFSIALGDSIRIQASVSAPNGAGTVVYRANYDGTQTPAFTSETANLNGLAVATLDNRLKAAAGQTAGSVYVVVEVTGLGGNMGKDSVKIVVAN